MGGLGNYAVACEKFLQELKSSLTADEIEFLRADCASLGRQKWTDWIFSDVFRNEIHAFVAATPSKRRTKTAWVDPRLKGHLVLAAYHHVWKAQQVIDLSREIPIGPGGSYRDTALVAGTFFDRLLLLSGPEFYQQEWPFGGENPFA
ncbi:hypothetical protein [Trichlorobacter lovleyi]|uniref:hypothetical protein n=1 Tax=Trichlorobacter lovleyi TaxID=313985 RepID=UPI0023F58B31|nr:hypothetical protein [Trichlorobacter lovleyi]